ncbi:UNVERIFIED_CONTAM: Anaphase-promoting complex subunit [Sesamum latifolium]|uniref:Anaphase-promoting complex subunit n=1 Tax=Sesamum latifolium TaxID=2727402 RepID=A0AAW2WS80_9LAMI
MLGPFPNLVPCTIGGVDLALFTRSSNRLNSTSPASTSIARSNAAVGHLKLAQQFCDELGVLASCVTGVDMELKTEASLRHARTLLSANQYSQETEQTQKTLDFVHLYFHQNPVKVFPNLCLLGPHATLKLQYFYELGRVRMKQVHSVKGGHLLKLQLLHTLYSAPVISLTCKLKNATVLLLLSEIHKRSGNAVLGIPYALACISFCQSFNLDLLRASATLTLAELWLSLGSNHAKKAFALLHSSFPVLLDHGGLELRSRAFITEAKCYLPPFCVQIPR